MGRPSKDLAGRLAGSIMLLAWAFVLGTWGAATQTWASGGKVYKYSLPLDAGRLKAKIALSAGLKTERVDIHFKGRVGLFGVGTTVDKRVTQDVAFCDIGKSMDELTASVAVLSVLDAFSIFNVRDLVPEVVELCTASEHLRSTAISACAIVGAGLLVALGLALALRLHRLALVAVIASSFGGAAVTYGLVGGWSRDWLRTYNGSATDAYDLSANWSFTGSSPPGYAFCLLAGTFALAAGALASFGLFRAVLDGRKAGAARPDLRADVV